MKILMTNDSFEAKKSIIFFHSNVEGVFSESLFDAFVFVVEEIEENVFKGLERNNLMDKLKSGDKRDLFVKLSIWLDQAEA